jgi:hypothetical protein
MNIGYRLDKNMKGSTHGLIRGTARNLPGTEESQEKSQSEQSVFRPRFEPVIFSVQVKSVTASASLLGLALVWNRATHIFQVCLLFFSIFYWPKCSFLEMQMKILEIQIPRCKTNHTTQVRNVPFIAL